MISRERRSRTGRQTFDASPMPRRNRAGAVRRAIVYDDDLAHLREVEGREATVDLTGRIVNGDDDRNVGEKGARCAGAAGGLGLRADGRHGARENEGTNGQTVRITVSVRHQDFHNSWRAWEQRARETTPPRR